MAAATSSASVDAGTSFVLSSEFVPYPEAPVQCVCVVDKDTIVTGGDDRLATVWTRTAKDSESAGEFAVSCVCPEAAHNVRALQALPVSATLPKGGFAAGSSDKIVRVYTREGTLVQALEGHASGVMSLSMTASGELISGAWDGTARVWDLGTYKCIQVLDGMENAICVLGMANGDIVCGSTGRKTPEDRHVDFKIRVWRAGTVFKTLTQHEQAVRDFAALPSGGFASASNDGTVRVWGADYSLLATFANPVSPRGEVPFAYRVDSSADGLLFASSEDAVLRVIDPASGVVQSIQHPSVAWGTAEIPDSGGDIVVVGQHPGTSHKGHVYVWTRDAGRAAAEPVMAQFLSDCKPPKSTGGDSGGGGGGSDLPKLPIKGAYEDREALAGDHEGQQAFFRKANGDIMMSTWSGAASCWTDIGVVQSSAEAEDSWDVKRTITMDLEGGGLATKDLKFNLDEDVFAVTQRFIVDNDIPTGYIEQIRDFVMKVMEEEQAKHAFAQGGAGAAGAASASSASAPASSRARTTTLKVMATMPAQDVVAISPIALDKVLVAILAKNDDVAACSDTSTAGLALTVDERATMESLVAVLKNEGFYHSSTLPAKPATAAVTKLAMWPGEYAAASYDLLRKMATHAEAAKVYMAPRLAEIVAAVSAEVGRSAVRYGTKATGLGLLSNLFIKPETRCAAVRVVEPMAAAAEACAANSTPIVRARAILLLCNAAACLAKEAESRGAKLDDDASLQAGAVAVARAAAECLKQADTTEELRASAGVAMGTAILCSEAARASAAAAGGEALAAAVAAKATASTQLAHVAVDLQQAFKE